MFLINSRSHLVTATDQSSRREVLHQSRHTFFRSYGVNLPSSLTRVLSSALEFSSLPPVSVWGTVLFYLKLRSFSWKYGIYHFTTVVARYHVSELSVRICLNQLPTHLNLEQPSPGWYSLLRLSIAVKESTGILTSFPSTTPFGLALGADSPCAD